MPKKPLLVLGLLLIITIGLTALWRWTPLADWFSLKALTTWASEFRRSASAPIWILAAFLIAGQVFFPITLLGLATVLAFGPFIGTFYSVVGSLLAGLVTYAIGRMLGETTVSQLAGRKLEQIREQIKQHGLATSITVHILPVAPFTLVNLLSGACGVGVRDFILGTLIGHLPGVVSIVIFQHQLQRAIRSPDPANITLLVVVIAGLTLGTLWLQRRVGKKAAARSAGRARGQ
jgi:phospholipase D1/2